MSALALSADMLTLRGDEVKKHSRYLKILKNVSSVIGFGAAWVL
jgi:hypothetical protein